MKDKWAEFADDIGRETVDRVDAALRRYAVPPASPCLRMAAADAAISEMERRRENRWQSLWGQIRVEARFLPLWYYLASLAVTVAGACLLLMNEDQAVKLGILVGMVPLPALLGLLEVFHGADEGMAEIECACRYSPARVLSARMVIIGALSCAASALLGICSRFGSAWMAAGLVVIPFCLSAATGLYLTAALRGRASSAQVALAVAFANGAAAMMLAAMKVERLVPVAPVCWLFMMALSAALLIAAMRGILKSAGKFTERNLMQWS